jgi:amino acid adenylation domain-containing protein
MSDCAVSAVVTDEERAATLARHLDTPLRVLGEISDSSSPDSKRVVAEFPSSSEPQDAVDGLAYILYTSGSTGRPKGVMHTHSSALSFIDWCSEELHPTPEDRFSSHAPFHFDLSILDLFVPIQHGASIFLVDDQVGKSPQKLAPLITENRLTVWYSTPSILRLLVEYGKLEERDASALRLVLFAGEVFPPKHLQALEAIWPHPRYYNLYGPTETNVCTFFESTAGVGQPRTEPVPIGAACSGDDLKVVDASGDPVQPGEDGELYVAGGSVTLGYWNQVEQTRNAFAVDDDGRRWYKTGDVVRDDGDGVFRFLGRRDRMIKRRGYRVELGEIESALYRHPHVSEAAAIAHADEQSGVTITAFLAWSGETKASVIELKRFCTENLPSYMVPDRFQTLPELPKTSTDKIDYQELSRLG